MSTLANSAAIETARFSAAGLAAKRRGLKPLKQLSIEMGVPESSLEKAPKAEWHHDLRTGAKVWFYEPVKVWSWWQKQRRKCEKTAVPEEIALKLLIEATAYEQNALLNELRKKYYDAGECAGKAIILRRWAASIA